MTQLSMLNHCLCTDLCKAQQHTDIAAYKFPGLKSEGYSPNHRRGGKTAIFFGGKNTPPSKNPVLRQKTLAPPSPKP